MNSERREVTERDFRMPEYKDAKIEDYEIRQPDGALVRKDRWEKGIQHIASAVQIARGWEVADVVLLAEKNAWFMNFWEGIRDEHDGEDLSPNSDRTLSVKLADGSVLHDVIFTRKTKTWTWRGVCLTSEVVGWRERKDYDDMMKNRKS